MCNDIATMNSSVVKHPKINIAAVEFQPFDEVDGLCPIIVDMSVVFVLVRVVGSRRAEGRG